MPEVTLRADALTTLEAVKDSGSSIDDDDPALDNNIRRLINSGTVRAMMYAQREFKSLLVGSQPRVFEFLGDGHGNGRVVFAPYDAQSISNVAVDTQGGSAGTILDATALDYQLDSVSQWGGVYTGLTAYSWWSKSYTTSTPWNVQRQVTVTGVWGWPSVPPDVEEGLCGQVIEWLNAYYRVVTNSPMPGEIPEPGFVVRRGLNAGFRATLDQYRRMVVVG